MAQRCEVLPITLCATVFCRVIFRSSHYFCLIHQTPVIFHTFAKRFIKYRVNLREEWLQQKHWITLVVLHSSAVWPPPQKDENVYKECDVPLLTPAVPPSSVAWRLCGLSCMPSVCSSHSQSCWKGLWYDSFTSPWIRKGQEKYKYKKMLYQHAWLTPTYLSHCNKYSLGCRPLAAQELKLNRTSELGLGLSRAALQCVCCSRGPQIAGLLK